MVQVILDDFNSPEVLESSGKVLLGSYVIEGATPLWCASGLVSLGTIIISPEPVDYVNRKAT